MLSFLSFLSFEAAMLWCGIWAVTHPSLQGTNAQIEAQFVIFMLYAFMAIGGMAAFINSWTKD